MRPIGRGTTGLLLAGVVLAAAKPAAMVAVPMAWASQVGTTQELMQRADVARKEGALSADATIDAFSDYACPDCRRFHLESGAALKELVASRNLRLTYRVYVIPRLMRGFQGAEAALCAGALHGRSAFKDMQAQLFQNQDEWRRLDDPTPMFEAYAQGIGLPMDRFRDCLRRDAMAALIITDILMASALQVQGTPTFVFNKAGRFNGDVMVYGAEPIEEFEKALAQVIGQ